MRGGLVVLAVLMLLTGCNAKDLTAPKGSDVKVDTPALVEAKQAAGVDDCVPGTAKAVTGGLPSVTLPCFGGGPSVDVGRLRGPMVVSLWAQSCGPCRQEMPVLEQFHQHYDGQVAVLGIDYLDTLPSLAMGLLQKTGATYPMLADPSGSLGGRGPLPVFYGLPQLLFVGADGKVAFIHPGPVRSEHELVDLVRQHLGLSL